VVHPATQGWGISVISSGEFPVIGRNVIGPLYHEDPVFISPNPYCRSAPAWLGAFQIAGSGTLLWLQGGSPRRPHRLLAPQPYLPISTRPRRIERAPRTFTEPPSAGAQIGTYACARAGLRRIADLCGIVRDRTSAERALCTATKECLRVRWMHR